MGFQFDMPDHFYFRYLDREFELMREMHELICRLPHDTTTKPSADSTSFLVSVLAETFPSMPSSLLNFYPRIDETWSRYSPCGNPSELLLRPVSLTVRSLNIGAIPTFSDAKTRSWNLDRHAVPPSPIWDGDIS